MRFEGLMRERSFEVELHGKNTGELITVVYEPEHLGSGEIEVILDERGRPCDLFQFSDVDQERIKRQLIVNLMSDRAESCLSDEELLEMARANREEWRNE